MKLYSADFFNWNPPFVQAATTEYTNTGWAFSAGTHMFLIPLGQVIQRPTRMVWQSCVARRDGLGDIGIQLWCKSAHDYTPSQRDISQYETFRSVSEEISLGGDQSPKHVWHSLSPAEIDIIMGAPQRNGLLFGVRQKSFDTVTRPAWFSSKLLISYD